MLDGFIKVGVASPLTRVGDIDGNCDALIKAATDAAEAGVKLLVFPELSLTGATLGDLILNDAYLNSAEAAAKRFIEATKDLDTLFFLGSPVRFNDRLYNCALAIKSGRLLGVVPKRYLSDSDARYFASSPDRLEIVRFAGQRADFRGLIFECESIPGLRIAAEIGEDMRAVIPPSSQYAMKGANLIVCLGSEPDRVGALEELKSSVSAHSARIMSAYLYSGAGEGESGTDRLYTKRGIIADRGVIRDELGSDSFVYGVIDVAAISHDRRENSNFFVDAALDIKTVDFELDVSYTELDLTPNKFPFLPSVGSYEKDLDHILELQARALALRMSRSYSKRLVIGVSGGLDSTLAMLVCAEATDILGLPRSATLAVTMPAFGTTGRTKSNAERLSLGLGTEFRSVNISESVRRHFADLGHDGVTPDVTFENSQARERTQLLMDIANMENGLVVGTGDLSELILGWATYNGDHMSMFGVNGSLPKTLIRHVVKRYADKLLEKGDTELSCVLYDILDTPVSPELLPAKDGEIAQKTEDLVGPYELHDFFIYNLLVLGFGPKKVYRLARRAFGEEYSPETVKKWLTVFVKRFISQQFKRSCLPDGVQVGILSVSPRGALVMPSDTVANVFLKELSELKDE